MQLLDLIYAIYHLPPLIARVRQQDSANYRRLDRELGQTCTSKKPAHKLLLWLNRHQANINNKTTWKTYWQLGLLLGSGGSFVVGWSTAQVAFAYDGQIPINLIPIVTLFAILPTLLLLPILVLLIPASSYAPNMLNYAQHLVLLVSPGRLLTLCRNILPTAITDAVSHASSTSRTHKAILKRMSRLLAVVLMQLLSFWFLLGVLLCAFYKVMTSDLAFGWSVTPQTIDAQLIHQITSWLSSPWATLAPEALPSKVLVSNTRFYQLTKTHSHLNPALFAQWWSFVLLSILTWGVIPRAISSIAGYSVLRHTLRQTLLDLPGARGILDRLENQHIETVTDTSNTANESNIVSDNSHHARSSITSQTITRQSPQSNGFIIYWGLDDFDPAKLSQLRQEHFQKSSSAHAGGNLRLQYDHTLLLELSKLDASRSILIVVKAWEPPLQDFFDFIANIRKTCGETREIQIALLETPYKGQLKICRPSRVWELSVAKHLDPWVVFFYPDTEIT